MKLQQLTKQQLQDELLNINSEYLRLSFGEAHTYMNNPDFLAIREKLHAVLDELRRRRENS